MRRSISSSTRLLRFRGLSPRRARSLRSSSRMEEEQEHKEGRKEAT